MYVQSKKHANTHKRNRNLLYHVFLTHVCLTVSEIWKHPVCWASHAGCSDGPTVVFLKAPIPGIVLSYRLSRSLRGWSPAHHGLSASASDGSLSHPQPQEQPQQPQQHPLPDSEYGAIAKFAGTVWCFTWWWSGRRSGGALVSISEVNLRRARLVPGWVAVFGFSSRCGTFISVCNQPASSTQPGHPYVGRRNEYQPNGDDAFRLESKKRQLVHVWVVGKTVWSHYLLHTGHIWSL